jgi:hypothetical protein
MIRWPGHVPAGKVENSIIPGLDWFPTLVAAAGNPNITAELLNGKKLGDQNFKVHLDGYNQLDLITGKGPSARREIFYFTEGTLSGVRVDDFKYRFTDHPGGWLGATEKVDWPILTNLRLDPFERTGMYNSKDNGSINYYEWFAFEFWRFAFVQEVVGKLAQTAIDFPPMQPGASLILKPSRLKFRRPWPANLAASEMAP